MSEYYQPNICNFQTVIAEQDETCVLCKGAIAQGLKYVKLNKLNTRADKPPEVGEYKYCSRHWVY